MPSFIPITFDDIKFNIAYKVIQTEGFIAYEYNPFRNLRLSEDRYAMRENRYIFNNSSNAILDVLEYKLDKSTNKYYPKWHQEELTLFNIDTEFYISKGSSLNPLAESYPDKTLPTVYSANDEFAGITEEELKKHIKYTPRYLFSPPHKLPNSSSSLFDYKFKVENYKNELVDFQTKNLKLDINHPVDIEIQESYDGSVNLILNDDLNTPKIINSRFSPLEDGKYKVVDRAGSNDTNIYDEETIVGETNLYKSINQIPNLMFGGVSSGGNLKVGNYVFYFKYVDSDGNETDFVAESGIVSIMSGNVNDPKSTKGALGDTNAFKIVRFTLNDIDSSYNYINVYYTRSTGDEYKNEITRAYKIDNKYLIRNTSAEVTVTGLENTTEISINDINIQYNVVNRVKSQTQVQSRLFFGNVDKVTIPYEELADLSLRIYPTLTFDEEVELLTEEYTSYSNNSDTNNEYYNPNNLYYRVGYWEDIYRFGVVYILNDYTLSPVFNTRGIDFKYVYPNTKWQTKVPIYELIDGTIKRKFVEVSDLGFIEAGSTSLENAKGVVRVSLQNEKVEPLKDSTYLPTGIRFNFQEADSIDDVDLITELRKYTKGFFIVRQKRIPTVYCQGLTIGQDLQSKLPMIPISEVKGKVQYMTESFLADQGGKLLLLDSFTPRIRKSEKAVPNAALVPEAELNSELFSQLFCGSRFNIRYSSFQPDSLYFTQGNNIRHYYVPGYVTNSANLSKNNVLFTYVGDNIQLKYSSQSEFSSRAGEAETAYKVSYLEQEDKTKAAKNLLRGAWSPYVGVEGINKPMVLFDVMIQGYDESLMTEYFKSRFDINSEYFAICNRTSWDRLYNTYINCYRGDCFLGTYTHRMCRNFQDPDTPTNDIVVNINGWADNYSGYEAGGLDMDAISNLNRGDVNAVMIGHWCTFKCLSNLNFASRVEDDRNESETIITGHPRTWYPIRGLTPGGEYKVPDSTLINKGLDSTTSDKYNFILPDVPYIKNEFSNRIMYSDIHVTDAFKNSYRTFQLDNYRDYNKEFGSIISIVEWYGNIVVVFEHGVGLIPVNERVQVGDGDGGDVNLNSTYVLPERPNIISKMYGSQWEESVIKTDRFIYGVDTVAKKIWRTNGRDFEIISDFKIQKFLNENISLTERERTPLLGIRNVKTHFNAFKFDVMFTFYDNINTLNELGERVTSREWNLCFNEKTTLWTTRYSWIPLVSDNIYNVYFSYDKEAAKNISKVSSSWYNSYTSYGIVLKGYKTQLAPSGFNKVTSIYSGVVFHNLKTTTQQECLVGILDIKMNLDTTKFKVKRLNFSFVDTENYPDNSDFSIRVIDNVPWLIFLQNPTTYNKYLNKDYADLKLEVEIIRGSETVGQRYVDTISVRKDTVSDNYSWFWRHGKAGIFDNAQRLYHTAWYKDRITDTSDKNFGKPVSYDPFEFEFVVNANVGLNKIFTNLKIISGKVYPYQISYEVIGDSYEFKDYKEDSFKYQKYGTESDDYIEFKKIPSEGDRPDAVIYFDEDFFTYSLRKNQTIKSMDDRRYGIIGGNARYKEDLLDITLEPFKYKSVHKNSASGIKEVSRLQETRPRDKFIRIRVKYTGELGVVITALQTMFNVSFS